MVALYETVHFFVHLRNKVSVLFINVQLYQGQNLGQVDLYP